MKVIILCANYEPGGAQRAALRLKNELGKTVDSECWFMHRKSPDFSDTEPKLILNRKVSSVSDVFKIYNTLKKEFKREEPNAVISFLPYSNILGLFAAYRCGIKIRISSHRNLGNKELSFLLKVFDYLWAHLGIYTGITAVSQSTKKSFSYYSKRVYNQVKVINNGISFTPSLLSQAECRKKFGISEYAFIIGNIGRLVDQKNQMLLVNILPQLQDVLLVIVGKGELKEQLENRAAELGVRNNLLIIDELNVSVIPDFLKAIDIFVMPSNFEGMSNALAEALYAGVAIVSSDVESQVDVLLRESDGLKAGVMVSNNLPVEWVKAILTIRNDKQFRNGLCKNALIRANDFTVGYMAEGFKRMLG